MKKLLTLGGLLVLGAVPAFSQGFINFSYTGNGFTTGIQVGGGGAGIPATQQIGWYVGNDYSVEAYMAAGNNQPEGSLSPIASTFIRVGFQPLPTTAAGAPGVDGSGLFQGGAVDTGLPIGPATIKVWAWYDPNHNTSLAQAFLFGVKYGASALLNITTVANSDPTIQSLDTINMPAFTVGVPEPSSFALAGLGAAALLIFRRRK
jgi:hypothetical protein